MEQAFGIRLPSNSRDNGQAMQTTVTFAVDSFLSHTTNSYFEQGWEFLEQGDSIDNIHKMDDVKKTICTVEVLQFQIYIHLSWASGEKIHVMFLTFKFRSLRANCVLRRSPKRQKTC